MEQSHGLSTDEVFIKSLTDAVLDNLGNEQFGVEGLSNAVGLSRSQIHRKLQRNLGKSVTQFVREIRLEEAHKLLRDEAGTAAEISYQVGFNSPTYFNTCFHEYFGFPPGEIKKSKIRAKVDRHSLSNEKESVFPLKGPNEGQSKYKRALDESGSILSVLRPKSRSNRAVVLAIFLTLILAMAIAISTLILLPRSIYDSSPGSSGKRSIAVLPFKYDNSVQGAYFADGVVADIQYNLSMMGGLRIISRTSMERFRESKLSAKEIAEQLKVDYLLEGGAQKNGSFVKLHISLIDGKSEDIVWTNVYQHNLDNYFETQNLIASSVAEALYVNITPEEHQRIYQVPTSNQTAYDYYARALEQHTKHWMIPDTIALNMSIEFYRSAIRTDPNYSNAWAGLALAYYDKIGLFNLDNYSSPYWDSLLICSDRAIQFNDQLGEAYLVRSIYEYGKNKDIAKALEQVDLALKYDPNNCRAFEQKAIILWLGIGKNKEAIVNITEASKRVYGLELAQLYGYLIRLYNEMGYYELSRHYIEERYSITGNEFIYNSSMAFLEFGSGNYEEAISWYEKKIKNDPNQIIPPVCLMGARQYEKAYVQSRKYMDVTNGDPSLNDLHRIGFSYWNNGFIDEGLKYINEHIKRTQNSINDDSHYSMRKYAYYDLAACYAFLGEKKKALDALTDFKNRHSYPLYAVNMLKTDDPMFDNIRREPQFQEIVEHVEQRYLKERSSLEDWLTTQNKEVTGNTDYL